ncbi:hypothetical protein [Streptomyces sp. NPDC057616]|uniref:hypothetical protein n=1 Tax=Streptomyces sp. NPDC057616 TaxID=3346183 RepID=UPI0036B99431
MGDRHSDRGARARRHAHPGGARPGPLDGPAGPALESLIAGVLRTEALDADAERRAVAAFRAARETAVHGGRTRRRDDWRPREHRRIRRSLRVTFTLSLAGLTLGGVAFAAIDSVHGSSHDGHGSGQRTHASAAPSGTPSHTPGSTAAADRPETAKDTEAHCQAYEKVKDSGKALDSTAWQRLIAAAGGKDKVAAYCAAKLAGPSAGSTPSATRKPKNPRSTQRGRATKNPDASGSGGSSGSAGAAGSSGSTGAGSGKKDK